MTTELLPLRTGFDVAWLGYRRDQVQYYVGEAERDFALLAADRDAAEARAVSLARNLEAAREENRALRDRIDRLCRQPLSPESVGERLRHAVDAAHQRRRDSAQRRTFGGLAHDDAGGVQADARIALAFEHAHAQPCLARRQRAGRTGEARPHHHYVPAASHPRVPADHHAQRAAAACARQEATVKRE